MSTAEPATVTLTLGSTPHVLRPSFEASRTLNRIAGGFLPLFRAVGQMDVDTMALVVAAGTGTRGEAVENLARAMWEAGLEDLVDPLGRFLTLCMNGGRDPEATRAKAGEDMDETPTDGDAA